MGWFYLLFAGLLEIGGVLCIKWSDGFKKWKPLIGAFIFMTASFTLLSLSLKEVPISIAYGIWTGIGASGSVLLGMFFFREPKSALKLLLVFGIVASMVGLKFV